MSGMRRARDAGVAGPKTPSGEPPLGGCQHVGLQDKWKSHPVYTLHVMMAAAIMTCDVAGPYDRKVILRSMTPGVLCGYMRAVRILSMRVPA